jgi:hypothetical protein
MSKQRQLNIAKLQQPNISLNFLGNGMGKTNTASVGYKKRVIKVIKHQVNLVKFFVEVGFRN